MQCRYELKFNWYSSYGSGYIQRPAKQHEMRMFCFGLHPQAQFHAVTGPLPAMYTISLKMNWKPHRSPASFLIFLL